VPSSLIRDRQWFPFSNDPVSGAIGRLICVPHAGAGATAYYGWAATARHRQVQLWAAELPGRGLRAEQPPLLRVSDAADQLASALNDALDLPLLLHGHSMGALVAFETARRLESRGRELCGLLVTGMVAPQMYKREHPLHVLSDDEFGRVARDVFELPSDLFDDPDVSAMLLPVLRNDLQLTETYTFEPGSNVCCPIVVVAGSSDKLAPPEDMAHWAAVTRSNVQLHTFPGDHFFLHSNIDDMVDLIHRLATRDAA
jgi:surfactin synthase thioesterase subunit